MCERCNIIHELCKSYQFRDAYLWSSNFTKGNDHDGHLLFRHEFERFTYPDSHHFDSCLCCQVYQTPQQKITIFRKGIQCLLSDRHSQDWQKTKN